MIEFQCNMDDKEVFNDEFSVYSDYEGCTALVKVRIEVNHKEKTWDYVFLSSSYDGWDDEELLDEILNNYPAVKDYKFLNR